jgi:SAM-dependent methyltransferase
VDQLRALVEPALSQAAGAIAIYGAGAGRLAVDIHESRRPHRTYALDTNPLPLIVADALTRGETVELPELAVAPRTEEDIVIDHHLRAPARQHPGLHWLFADGLRPPFAAGALDAVVTCWFIDVVAADVRVTAAAINRVLRPGGLWLDVSPLRFRGALAQQYAIDEVHAMVGASAFALRSSSHSDVPYFDSPHSGARRIETVFAFCAEKTGASAPVSVPTPAAPWVSDPRLPIAVSPPLVAMANTSIFTASVLGLVDGTRSMVDIAEALGRNWQIEPAAVLDQLRSFFAKLPN